MITKPLSPDDIPPPPEELQIEDGIPLESDWHRLAMTLLIELVGLHYEGRDDYFVGGNMFIYFSAQQARNRDFRGPDFLFVKDVPLNPPRPYWAVWLEGNRYPDVIIELTSPSTIDEDFGVKFRTYESVLCTKEYFIYDPASHQLQGWRLDGKYREIAANDEGHLWCEELGLWLGTWLGKYQEKKGVYPRFFDADGQLVLTSAERAENERRQSAAFQLQAMAARERADAEKQRADAEKQRADAAEAELAKLRGSKP